MSHSVDVGKRIRELREDAGLSLQDIAEKTGYSSALISQFENHMISPPLGALIKLSRVLNVDVGNFFGEVADQNFVLVRSDERETVSRVASKSGVSLGYTYEALGFGLTEHHMEPFVVTLEPVPIREKHLSVHEGEEFIYVLEGRMMIRLGEHTDILQAGDSIYFKCTTPHHVTCAEGDPAKILAVIFTGKTE
ncbi:MAG: cupin domain-containing protein [Pseudomonadota bacterium]|jgi:transcriptional regulator with XRE-family HTH domain/quercetin dioxygenase-like cupin family protein